MSTWLRAHGRAAGIGLGTNVIVRYLAQDDPRQSAAAAHFIERALSPENPGLITTMTLCEVVWVLAESYSADRARIRAGRRGPARLEAIGSR